MKFNKTLIERALPEWRIYLLDYKSLKRAIKEVVKLGSESGHDSVRFFEDALETELVCVAVDTSRFFGQL